MKKLLVISCFIHCTIIIQAQRPTVTGRNFFYLDSVEQVRRTTLCAGDLRADTTGKEDRHLVAIIDVLNDILQDSFQLSSLDVILKKIAGGPFSRQRIDNGGIKILDISVPAEGFYVSLRLESVEDLVIRKRYMIESRTNLICNKEPNVFPNFPLLKQVVAKHADFFIALVNDDVWSDTLVYKNIDVLSGKNGEYRIIRKIKGEGVWVNQILEDQFRYEKGEYYDDKRPEKHFVQLLTARKDTIIRQLLYSPNYFFSVNAMEVLFYLDHIGRIRLTAEEKDRIAVLKNERNGTLKYLAGHVLYVRNGYRELGTSDEQVIKKYGSWK